MKIFLIKKLNAFYPADSVELGKIHGLKNGETYKAVVTKPRNSQHHRKYWAMIGLIMDNLPDEMALLFRTPDHLHTELKLQAGLFDIHYTLGGKEIPKVHSINFGAMDQIEFEAYYDKTLEIVAKYIIPNIDKQDIEEQLLNF